MSYNTEQIEEPVSSLCGAAEEGAAFSRLSLFRDSIAYFLGKVIPGFFGLISVPVFVRLIGLEEYGRLAVLLPVLMALGGAGSGWLTQGALRFHPVPDDAEKKKLAFNQAVLWGTVYSVLASSVALMGALAAMRYSLGVSAVALAYCAVLLTYTVLLVRLQARLLPQAVLKNEALRATLGFLLPVAIVLIARKQFYAFVLLGLTLGYLIPLLLAARSAAPVPHIPDPAGRFSGENSQSPAILKKLWKFGWAIGAWLLLCQLLPIIGRSAIQRYAGYQAAGTYASMYEVAVRSFSLFAFPVTQAAHPRIMQHWNQGQYPAARLAIRHSVRWQVLMFLPIELAGIAFSRPLTGLILGHGNSAPRSLLPLLMLGGFLWQLALLAHKPLEVMQRTKTMLAGMILVVLLELLGNYLLVPRFGAEAAVYVFVLGAIAYLTFVALNNPLTAQNSANPLT